MSHINDSSPVEQGGLSGRRLLAGVIDGGLVALGTGLVGLMMAERFSILERTDGRPVFSEADQLRINQIDEGFNRAVRLGDTVLTLSGVGWWATMATLITLTAILFVIVPTRLRRRTPGRVALRLPRRAAPTPMEPLEILSVTEVEVTEVEATEPDPEVDHPGPEPAAPEPADPIGDRTLRTAAEDRPVTAVDLTDRPTAVAINLDPDLDLGSDPDPAPVDDLEPSWTSVRPHNSRFSTVSPGRGGVRTIERLAAAKPARQITLADADDYLVWDRLEAAAQARAAGQEQRTPDGVDLTVESAGAPVPQWNEDWKAWLYHDAASGRWFRHQARTDDWVPVD